MRRDPIIKNPAMKTGFAFIVLAFWSGLFSHFGRMPSAVKANVAAFSAGAQDKGVAGGIFAAHRKLLQIFGECRARGSFVNVRCLTDETTQVA